MGFHELAVEERPAFSSYPFIQNYIPIFYSDKIVLSRLLQEFRVLRRNDGTIEVRFMFYVFRLIELRHPYSGSVALCFDCE